MNQPLLDNIIAKPQRETAGSDAALRFDYQKDWAFCKMLDLHLAGEDYLVAFEYHDDVVFLDSEQNPQKIDFYQVKTQKGPEARKLSTLTTKRKNSNSIIAKLCSNLNGIHKSYPIRLFIVSNRPYDFSAKNICGTDLGDELKKKIIDKVKAEIPAIDDSFIDALNFHVTEVPLNDVETYLNGKVLGLFKQRFGENGPSVWGWTRLVQGEIKRRNNTPSDQVKTIADLKSLKCIGKSFIEETLTLVGAKHNKVPDMKLITTDLVGSGWTTAKALKLDKAMAGAIADFQDPSNTECISIVENIDSRLSSLDCQNTSLKEILEGTSKNLLESGVANAPYNDAIYLMALTILVYYEKL